MNLKKTPTVTLIKELDKLNLEIEICMYKYEEYRKELVERFPFLEQYEEFKERYKQDEKNKVHKI